MFIQVLVLVCVVSTAVCQPPPFVDTCVNGAYPPKQNDSVKEYVINLDLPAQDRWTQLAKEKSTEIRNVLKAFKSFLYDFGYVPQEVVYLLDLLGPELVKFLPEPYQDEMVGLAHATGLEIGEIALYNIFYELFTVCTSVIAEDPNGRLYHARNLDFGLFMGWDPRNKTWSLTEVLRPSVVNLDFQRAGKTVFKSVNFAGFIGILTAIVPGKFTFSLNERFKLDGGFVGIFEKIRTGKGNWTAFTSRRVMETAQSFERARQMLTATQLIAPVYFILGGNSSGQAVVITRNREVNGTDLWTMKSKGAGGWYVLETNYDHWSKPLIIDDRRTPANKCMQKMTQKNVGNATIFDVLSSKPVLNKLTTYTALMQVNSGHLESWLRYCPDPCEPW